MKRFWNRLCYWVNRHLGKAADDHLTAVNEQLVEQNRYLEVTIKELQADVRVSTSEQELLVKSLERMRTQLERDIAINVRESIEPPDKRTRRG